MTMMDSAMAQREDRASAWKLKVRTVERSSASTNVVVKVLGDAAVAIVDYLDVTQGSSSNSDNHPEDYIDTVYMFLLQ
jgi:hypothetical protein